MNESRPSMTGLRSFRWLLAVVAGFAVCAMGLILMRGLQQKRLVDELDSEGAVVELETRFPKWLGDALRTLLGDDRMEASHDRMFGRIITVRVYGDWFTDQHMARAGGFQAASRIELSQTSATAAGLKHLAGNSSLTSLSLDGVHIDDDAVEQLLFLPNLEDLNLSGTAVTSSPRWPSGARNSPS